MTPSNKRNSLLIIFMTNIMRSFMVSVGGTVRVRLDRESVFGSTSACLCLYCYPTFQLFFPMPLKGMQIKLFNDIHEDSGSHSSQTKSTFSIQPKLATVSFTDTVAIPTAYNDTLRIVTRLLMIVMTYIIRPIMVSVGGTVRYGWIEIQCSVQLQLAYLLTAILHFSCFLAMRQGRQLPPRFSR